MGTLSTLTGPPLAVLTCAMTQVGISSQMMAMLSPLTHKQAEQHAQDLQQQGLLTRHHRGGWRCTLKGVECFYHTLHEIRDVLSPEQQAPTLPFSMTTNWRECLCLNYRVDPDLLQTQLSPVFEPVIIDGYGIVSVTLSSIVSMRPQGLPELLGQNFCNISCRAVVQFRNKANEQKIGYEFIQSATNSDIFTRIGNTITEYRFHDFATGPIHFIRHGRHLLVGVDVPSRQLDLVALIDTKSGTHQPPSSSIFSSRAQLDRLVIDHTDAFGYEKDNPFVYILRINRDRWHYTFIEPIGLYAQFFQEGTPFGPDNAELDSVLYCQNIRYAWEPLIKETLLHGGGIGKA